MKITKIKTYICHAYRTNWVFVKIFTDTDGLHGVGEATLEYKELTVAQAIQELEDYLIGKDPHQIEMIWHDIYRDGYWRGGAVLMSAFSAIEMALWDIKGQVEQKPLYKLLSETNVNNFDVYSSGGSVTYTPDEIKKDIEI